MQVSCAFCDGLLETDAEDLGQQISCPHCSLDFELTADLIAEEETATGSFMGSWFSGSLSTIISIAIHTVILVLCAFLHYAPQVNELSGEEVMLAELPVQQTLTTSNEPEQLEAESIEAESDSESLSELDMEIVSTTDAGSGSGDLSQAIEALTSSGASGSGGTSIAVDGMTSVNLARSGDEDPFRLRGRKGAKDAARGSLTAALPAKAKVQQQVLRKLTTCGYGFGWKKVPGGYLCKANVCRISDAQFDAQYKKMYPGGKP